MRIVQIALILAMAGATVAHPQKSDYDIQNFTGTDFVQYCPDDIKPPAGGADHSEKMIILVMCMDYVNGFAGGLSMGMSVDRKGVDFLTGRSPIQIYAIVRKYVKDRPNQWDQTLQVLIGDALLNSKRT